MELIGPLQLHPSRRRDEASSLDASLLKAYPKQAAVCSTVGGSAGAIDPKTLRKYMWPFIRAVANFEPAVVRNNGSVLYIF